MSSAKATTPSQFLHSAQSRYLLGKKEKALFQKGHKSRGDMGKI